MGKYTLEFYSLMALGLILVIANSVSGISYSLYFNMTFSDMTIGNFSEYEEYQTQVLEIISSGCKTNPCAHTTNSEMNSFYYLQNFRLDLENSSWKVAGWLQNPRTNPDYPNIAFFVDSNNYFRTGYDNLVGNMRRTWANNLAGTLTSEWVYTGSSANQNYLWCEQLINKGKNITFQCWSDSSKATSIFDYFNFTSEFIKSGFFSIYSGGPTYWDDLEIWQESVEASIEITLDENFNTTTAIWSNVSCSGTSCLTAEYFLYDLDLGLVYNGSSNFFNYTGLTNNTQYRLRWNASIEGATSYFDFNITTLQTEQVVNDYCYENYLNTNSILEVLNMIWIVALYIFFTLFGYHLLSRWSLIPGYAMLLMSLFFDFFLVAYLYENYVSVLSGESIPTRLYGIFGLGVLFWIAIKLIFVLSIGAKKGLNKG